MHTHALNAWTHDHLFLGDSHGRNERRTRIVIALTLVMMAVEIVCGTLFGSMALLADGWHMGTHAAALGISAFAYLYARRHAHDPRFSFGTGKFGELAAFTSALALIAIALLIGVESVHRIVAPAPIAYGEAIAVAVIGLLWNLGCALLLRQDGDHHHGHGHSHGHDHHHGQDNDHDHRHGHVDLNLRAAYLHVLADAATSVMAIVGLALAWSFQWAWMDPLVGIAGACAITIWSLGLIRDAGRVLLDIVPDQHAADEIRRRLETGDDRVADLHLWQVGPGHLAVVASIVTHQPQPPSAYKAKLKGIAGLSHISIEIEVCPGGALPA